MLDDAFQHRQVSREADFVLVSADRWSTTPRLLPGGPLARASRGAPACDDHRRDPKGGNERDVDVVNESLADDRAARSTIDHPPRTRRDSRSDCRCRTRRAISPPVSDVAGRAFAVLTAIGDPRAFLPPDRDASERRVSAEIYPDHHHFEPEEIARFVRSIPPDGLAICTLKDAVKLADRWPREAPTLWYVSQRVSVERGVGGVEHILDELTRLLGGRER